MCNYNLPRQFAYIDPTGKFQRLGTQIDSKEQMISCKRMIDSKAVYESVYGWTGWKGGILDAEISKTAIIDGMFFDFDDAADPERAIRDAAEVAAFVGDHCTTNFSGAKGAHVRIDCHVANLVPDLKSAVLRGFANMLCDRLPELSTMDWSVIGDTSRVSRIIDSVHPGTKLHAIGLSTEELATRTIDEIREMAANKRGLVQVHEPSQWATDELYRIEEEILHTRLTRLYDQEQIAGDNYRFIDAILQSPSANRVEIFEFITQLETEWRRIKKTKAENTIGWIIDQPVGRSPEETWLIRVVDIFKVVQRMNSIRPKESKVSTSSSEHEARCHITKLMRDCGWTRSQMHEVFSYADDYDHTKTERQINSLIGRV